MFECLPVVLLISLSVPVNVSQVSCELFTLTWRPLTGLSVLWQGGGHIPLRGLHALRNALLVARGSAWGQLISPTAAEGTRDSLLGAKEIVWRTGLLMLSHNCYKIYLPVFMVYLYIILHSVIYYYYKNTLTSFFMFWFVIKACWHSPIS